MFDFEVKIAQDEFEIEGALKLRHEVFKLEMGSGRQDDDNTGFDRDAYDSACDHLIVIDKTVPKIVGTYRLLRGSKVDKNLGFYSEKSFDIHNITKLSDGFEIVELGRSCIHRDYRTRPVINLLWNGIAKYIKDFQIRYLFGHARLLSKDPKDVSHVFQYITERFYSGPEFRVYPKPASKFQGLQKNVEIGNPREIIRMLPALIKGYIRVGVKVCGLPAVNTDLGSVVIFILLDVENISRAYKEHFL